MTRLPMRLIRLVMLGLVLAFATIQPAAAQSLLRDSETELLFRDLSRPLIQAAGLDPANVKIVLINDPEINAFVAGGQIVYIHTGLLMVADNANQLQGVIAHELGHIAAVTSSASAKAQRRRPGSRSCRCCLAPRRSRPARPMPAWAS